MVNVIKNDGRSEPFLQDKVRNSIERAGVPKYLQEKALSHIKEKLFDGITTSEIHNHIKEFLRTSEEPHFVVKYDLKRAIMELGPTGYPFEDYVAKLLIHQGYKAKTRTIVRGKCVTHEIDVIATKPVQQIHGKQAQGGQQKTTMIECKYHNGTGIRTDVHVALYTQARFEDSKVQNHFDNVMLITNTQITTDAIAYGECMGMEIVSWNHPAGNSLRDWIENMALYPITALTALTNSQKAQLLQQDIVLCQDICKNESVLERLELSRAQKEEIKAEANFACAR